MSMRTIEDYKESLHIEIDHYFEEIFIGIWKNNNRVTAIEKEKPYQKIYDDVSEIISSTE